MKSTNNYNGDTLRRVTKLFLIIAIGASCYWLNNIFITSSILVAALAVEWYTQKKLTNKVKDIIGDGEGHSFSDIEKLISGYKSGMNEAASLISALGQEGERKFESLKEDDQLAVSIKAVDQKLKDYTEEERKRNWGVEGLAKFGEILRSHDIEISELSKIVISNLVQYLNANQGGLFLLKRAEGDEYLELMSCYAYGKTRIREKRIEIGQGLIGQCVLEKDTIYLLDVPQDYVQITSGLGEATAANVIIVPLKINEVVYGVVEIATFDPLKKYQVAFVEQLAENIASVFASLSNNEKTKELLEEANTLTSELQSREEEMRQNMEELTATQEEMSRNQAELNGVFGAINKTIASVTFELDGSIIDANDIFTSITGYTKEKLLNLNYLKIIPDEDRDKPQTKLMWTNLREGKFFNGEFKLKDIEGKELWLTGTFNPINNIDGEPYKIMMFAQFNTAEKEKQKDLTGTVMALKNTTPIMELNADGTFKNANELFFDQFGYKRLELRKKPFLEFIKDKTFEEEIPDIIHRLEDHQFIENDLVFIDSSGNLKSYRTTFTPIFNLEDKLSKIVVVLIDREVVMKL
ncbi:PAS domain S-box protein [Fulvivirga lutea]|uniref:PAS domain S-box protein n=1 Tax=Fulvivirga lutea TaxID=2810512 RepID=A0A974WG05_9BACT|nr:PAS domain S-box protein [Fulvivirga lutea]QSE97576.1 PAS domain S-box protein [Fulvivirga lutea]